MFAEMAEAQGAVVSALLDEIARDDWRFAWIHVAFGAADTMIGGIREGFLVLHGGERVWLELNPPVGAALDAMRQTYAQAGQGFTGLELLVENGERYRFELGHETAAFDAALADRRHAEFALRA